MLSDPRIIANDSISIERQIRRIHAPPLQGVKRKCGYGIHLMIGAVHHKLNPGGNLTEPANDQPVPEPLAVMRHMAFKFRISNVGEITCDDIGWKALV